MAHDGQRYNSRMVCDPSYPEIDHNVFKKSDWSEVYGDAKEAISMNASESWVEKVNIHMFVDSDHVGEKVSCRLTRGFLT